VNIQRVPAYLDLGGKKTEIGSALVDNDMRCATITVTDRKLASFMERVLPGVSIDCNDHKPRQHRDAKPPWCDRCGLTAGGELPVGRLDRPREDSTSESHHDFTD
jgi:hypothetical protein